MKENLNVLYELVTLFKVWLSHTPPRPLPQQKKKRNPTHQTSKCAEKSLWLTLSAICVSSYVAVLHEHTENPGDRSSEAWQWMHQQHSPLLIQTPEAICLVARRSCKERQTPKIGSNSPVVFFDHDNWLFVGLRSLFHFHMALLYTISTMLRWKCSSNQGPHRCWIVPLTFGQSKVNFTSCNQLYCAISCQGKLAWGRGNWLHLETDNQTVWLCPMLHHVNNIPVVSF